MGRRQASRPQSCKFCIDRGLEGCDWSMYSTVHRRECSACSDYRALNDSSDHVCVVPYRVPKTALRKYSAYDPHNFPDHFVCKRCVTNGIPFCDVDPYLNIGCSSCQGREGGVRKTSCKIAFSKDEDGQVISEPSDKGVEQELLPRPAIFQGIRKWFRRSCDTCTTGGAACSWLESRAYWDQGCDECAEANLACFDSGMLVEGPSEPVDGSDLTWRITREKRPAWAELNQSTTWRKGCTVCLLAGSHCRVLARLPYHACKKCSQLGLECIEHLSAHTNKNNNYGGGGGGGDGGDSEQALIQPSPRSFPLFDLSQVGFGGFLPFDACESCIEKGRNCDQQRPCDSCVQHQDRCDKLARTRVDMKNCFKGRLNPRPGPLYYLALGYGPGGVSDVKDGSGVEDWIGPPAPVYGRLHIKSQQTEMEEARGMRNELRPPHDPPPHGGADGPLEGVATGELTVAKLEQLILHAWPDAHPPQAAPEYYLMMSKWRERAEEEPEELRKQFPRRRASDSPKTTASYIDLTVENDGPSDDFGLGPILDFNAV